MKTVWIVQHLNTLPSGEDDVKLIGVYADQRTAEAAAKRLATQPGFSDHPKIIKPETDDDVDGFYIDEYEIGKDHWTEGYVTVTGGVGRRLKEP